MSSNRRSVHVHKSTKVSLFFSFGGTLVDAEHSFVQFSPSRKPHRLCAFSVLGSPKTVLP